MIGSYKDKMQKHSHTHMAQWSVPQMEKCTKSYWISNTTTFDKFIANFEVWMVFFKYIFGTMYSLKQSNLGKPREVWCPISWNRILGTSLANLH